MFINNGTSEGIAPQVEFPKIDQRWEYSAEGKNFRVYDFNTKEQTTVDALNIEFIAIGSDFMCINKWDMNHGYIGSGVIPTVPTGLPTPQTPIKEQQRWSAVWSINVGVYDKTEEKYKSVDLGNYNQLKEKYGSSYYVVIYALKDNQFIEIRLKGKTKTYFWEFLSASRSSLTTKHVKVSELEEVKIKKDTYYLPKFALGSDIDKKVLPTCEEKGKELQRFINTFKEKQLYYMGIDQEVEAAEEVFADETISPEDLPF